MVFVRFVFLLLLLTSNSVIGQLSIKTPLICHDYKGYLKCYSDGKYILHFENGNFKELNSSDSFIMYSEVDKTFKLLIRSSNYPQTLDTITVTQLPKSIMLKKGTSTLEITSLSNIPATIYDFGVGFYSEYNQVKGLSLGVGDKHILLEILTYGRTWGWNIRIWQSEQLFTIHYNTLKRNNPSLIFIKDFALKYGMSIGMTNKSNNKIRRLESVYSDTMTVNGITAIGDYPLDKYYSYEYSKSGKLVSKSRIGEFQLCKCD